ncbi:MAG: hypothetical protein AB7S78_04215 [Candidatus Omnitrophota bacterium]
MVSKRVRFILLFVGFFSVALPGFAEKSYYGFDERLQYDIYFQSGQNNTSVLQSVNIRGFQQIGGKEFLVIKSRGLKLSDESGYILFDSIIAILPERNFSVRTTDSIQLKQYQ